MPTFFQGLKRIFKGQPVFDESDPMQGKTSRTPAPGEFHAPKAPASNIRKYDTGSFPVVFLKHPTTHFNGNRMEVYCRIANNWPEEILIDKITIFDTRREIDATLRGRQEREFLVYSGPKLTRQSYEAFLDYKTTAEGDYFQSRHDVKYRFHAEDKTYEIDDVHLHLPIRDIYG